MYKRGKKGLMVFLRKKDDVCYQLASTQANVFERSTIQNIASYFFIQEYMNSNDAKSLDDLSFLYGNSSELEIYINTFNKTKRKYGGTVYPPEVMHWIGFFYRYAAYLTGMSSKKLFKTIPPTDLNKVYPLYHSLEISKAVSTVFDDINYQPTDRKAIFKKIYSY